MDDHIERSMRANNAYTPAIGFTDFCKMHAKDDVLKPEVARLFGLMNSNNDNNDNNDNNNDNNDNNNDNNNDSNSHNSTIEHNVVREIQEKLKKTYKNRYFMMLH